MLPPSKALSFQHPYQRSIFIDEMVFQCRRDVQSQRQGKGIGDVLAPSQGLFVGLP